MYLFNGHQNFKMLDRKSVVQGKSVDLGGRRIIKKKKRKDNRVQRDKKEKDSHERKDARQTE